MHPYIADGIVAQHRAPAQQLQVHLVQEHQAAVLPGAAAVRPHALRRHYAPVQLARQVHLPRLPVLDCSMKGDRICYIALQLLQQVCPGLKHSTCAEELWAANDHRHLTRQIDICNRHGTDKQHVNCSTFQSVRLQGDAQVAWRQVSWHLKHTIAPCSHLGKCQYFWAFDLQQ